MAAETHAQGGSLTLRELEQLLRRWGFRRERATESPISRHERRDAVIVLPPYGLHDRVAGAHLLTIRKLLTERGIVGEELFDRQLSSATAG